MGCSSWPTTSNSVRDTDVTMVTRSHDSRGSQFAEHPPVSLRGYRPHAAGTLLSTTEQFTWKSNWPTLHLWLTFAQLAAPSLTHTTNPSAKREQTASVRWGDAPWLPHRPLESKAGPSFALIKGICGDRARLWPPQNVGNGDTEQPRPI